ncbi:hypothetical protein PEDI_17140 [Persicobacter diffluens]|uniref:Thioredoxin domain-containing protein n=2 Tax=Persicobacter diffluens TaxID=981 RepID=A0AAN4VXB0_9BACT|nr:hypothetical protein PEDI_17140 [Persicobacter diffluens]
MLKKTFWMILFLVAVQLTAFAGRDNEGEIKWVSFEEAIEMAEQDPSKNIMIDFYTSWCGYCKKMDKTTFKDKDVVNAVNASFYAVKVNAESKDRITYKGENLTYADLARKFRVPGYPTILLLKSDLDKKAVEPGYKSAKQFTRMLEDFD